MYNLCCPRCVIRTMSIISGAHQFHSVTCDKRLNISNEVVPVVPVVVNYFSVDELIAFEC